MPYAHVIRGERFHFPDLRVLLAKANEEKSGDELAGIAAQSMRERVAAKCALAEVPLAEIVANPVVDPETDEVSRLILDRHDAVAFSSIQSMTIGAFRDFLLSPQADERTIRSLHGAITPEVAAAVAKVMGNKDLVAVASKIRTVTRCRNTLGERGIFAVRTQPNHPADDLMGILVSTLEGLTYGCGDAVIGINPATDSTQTVAGILHTIDRLITTLGVPTQACVLAHITTQLAALDTGAPVDLLFQSVAGTQAANTGFGISVSLLKEGQDRVRESHRKRDVQWVGDQFMYFETGQGSALSADAHHGVDQLTLEARAYAVARAFDPFLVNSVVGFIGPEYLADERQIIRAGLEDHFMGKLMGLPMGCDICYTNHAEADQNSVDNLLLLLAAAGVNFVMGVPAGDDVMLNYQSTSFHDAATVRELFGLRPAPEFFHWLETRGIFRDGRLAPADQSSLLAQYPDLLSIGMQ